MITNLDKFYVNNKGKSNTYDYEKHGVTFTLKFAGRANEAFIASTAKHSVILQDKANKLSEKEKERKIIEFNQKLELDVLVDSLLVSWSGVIDNDGKPVDFTVKTAKEQLGRFPDLVAELMTAAANPKNFTYVVDDEKK
jgi:hypothetical protein